MKTFLYNTLLLVLGNTLCAFVVKTILVPCGFLSGGLTGLSLLIYYNWKLLPLGALYLFVNIPVLLIGLKMVNFRFVFYTCWGMLIYSAMLFLPVPVQLSIDDRLMNAIVAGGISGLGIAIMLKSHGSAGGSEMISVLIYKFTGMSVGSGTMLINGIILGVSAFIFPVNDVLYTLIYIAVSAKVTDTIFHGLSKRKTVMIISDKWVDIRSSLTRSNLYRVTLLNGRGGFRDSDKSVLLSVVNRRHVSRLKSLVLKVDPNAFIMVMEASDVTGELIGNQPHW